MWRINAGEETPLATVRNVMRGFRGYDLFFTNGRLVAITIVHWKDHFGWIAVMSIGLVGATLKLLVGTINSFALLMALVAAALVANFIERKAREARRRHLEDLTLDQLVSIDRTNFQVRYEAISRATLEAGRREARMALEVATPHGRKRTLRFKWWQSRSGGRDNIDRVRSLLQVSLGPRLEVYDFVSLA